VARFLGDGEPALVLEAARAINDVPIAGALPELAARATRTGMPEPLARRVLNANFRLGGPAQAAALAELSARPETPAAIRVEALRALERLEDPGLADLVARAVDDRDARLSNEALRLLATLRPEEAARRLESRLGRGTVAERQGALRVLGSLASPAADAALS